MIVSCRWLSFAAAVSLGCVGCAVNDTDILHFLREHEHRVSAIEYRVDIPDSVAISAPRILEIDGETQRIQPDGKISLRLLGDVKVVGMTSKEIAAKLEVLLSRYYLDPKVRVRVLGYQSKNYYVHGQGHSGPRPYTGRDTLLDAVLSARVNKFLSRTSRVKVIRPTHGEAPVRSLVVDVDKMIRTGDWSRNILLEPDDIVYIPPTPAGWLAQRVQELLYPVAPLVQAYTAPAFLANLSTVYDRTNDGRLGGTALGGFGGFGGFGGVGRVGGY